MAAHTDASDKKNHNHAGSKKGSVRQFFLWLLFLLIACIIGCAGCLWYGFSEGETFAYLLLLFMATGAVIFSLIWHREKGENTAQKKGYRTFSILYCICLFVSLLFPKLPEIGWPMLPIFVGLALFSDAFSGLAAGCICLFTAQILGNSTTWMFTLYLLCGLVGILVFSGLEKSYHIGLPTFISLVCLGVLLCIRIMLPIGSALSLSGFTTAAINLMVSYLLLLLVLEIYSHLAMHRYREKYADINDPHFPLLVQLKEENKEEYEMALHVAHVSEKIGRKLGLQDDALKACGYYYRIGVLFGDTSWERLAQICEEYKFPPVVSSLLKECLDPKSPLVSRESALFTVAVAILTNIRDSYRNDPNVTLDYDRIIDNIFSEYWKDGAFAMNKLSVQDFTSMQKLFREEKLYYDFLR